MSNGGAYRFGSGGGWPYPQRYHGESAGRVGGQSFGLENDGYAGRLPHLYGGGGGGPGLRPWSSALGERPGTGSSNSAFDWRKDPPSRFDGGQRPSSTELDARGDANPFPQHYDALTAAGPYTTEYCCGAGAGAVPYRPPSAEYPRPRSAGISDWQSASGSPSLHGAGRLSHNEYGRGGDLAPMETPKTLANGGGVPAPPSPRRAQDPEFRQELPTGVGAELALGTADDNELLERIMMQQAELVESIRERLRAVQAKKQFLQEQLARVKEQELAEMRAAAEAMGRLEEEKAQCQGQLEQLQARLEDVREQRVSLARDYAARDAERRAAAARAAEEKEEVSRIRGRLEELQGDMQERLATEENRLRARVESARSASAQAERNARWLTEVEGRVAAAMAATPPLG